MSNVIKMLKSKEVKAFYVFLGILFVGFVCGFGVAGGFEPKTIQIENNIWEKGYFGINDIYNTCLYVSQEHGVLFDGYCYNELPSNDRAIESCITGCKLQSDYNEDIISCENYCNTCLVGDC